MEVIDDWYDSVTLESKLERHMDRLVDRFEKIVVDAMDTFDKKVDRMEKRFDVLSNHMNQLERHVHEAIRDVRMEKEKDHVDALDIKKIKQALSDLNILKEREINIMIREKIPFPFLLPKPHNSPLSVRIPFSKRNSNADGFL